MTNESFIRWQGRTIQQMGIVISVILGLSTASLGFSVKLFIEKKNDFSCEGTIFLHLSIFILLCAVGVSLWLIVNRLLDMRKTTQIARERGKEAPANELAIKRNQVRVLGRRTWCLFWWQLGLFGVGTLTLIVTILLTY